MQSLAKNFRNIQVTAAVPQLNDIYIKKGNFLQLRMPHEQTLLQQTAGSLCNSFIDIML